MDKIVRDFIHSLFFTVPERVKTPVHLISWSSSSRVVGTWYSASRRDRRGGNARPDRRGTMCARAWAARSQVSAWLASGCS